jgi:hypothetical protein
MDRSELLNQLSDAEWEVSHGARQLSAQRNAVRVLRTSMRDMTGAEKRLTDLESSQASSVSKRDRLRFQVELSGGAKPSVRFTSRGG